MRKFLVLGCFLPVCAYGITTVESNSGVQFSFNNPGARSMGMGGAFTALADDATAAFSNPAGLTALRDPELSLEARHSDFTTVFTDRGRLQGSATGVGLDTVEGIQRGEASDTATSLGFLSYSRRVGENTTLAFYRHQLADYQASFQASGAFVGNRGFRASDGFPLVSRVNPTDNTTELEITSYGMAAGFRVSDSLSLGLSIAYHDFEIDSLTRRYGYDADGDTVTTVEERASVLSFEPALERFRTAQSGDDEDIGFSAGFLWKPNSRFGIGGFYRSAPEFDYDFSFNDVQNSVQLFQGTTSFNAPESYGIGFSLIPTDQWRIALDVNRLDYSTLTEDVVLEANGDPFDGFLSVEDGTEVRFGAEYTFLTDNPIALRFGVWEEPAHVIAFTGDDITLEEGTPASPANRINSRAVHFLQGEDEIHYSIGGGIVFQHFQIDIAADLSDRADLFTLSAIYRFD